MSAGNGRHDFGKSPRSHWRRKSFLCAPPALLPALPVSIERLFLRNNRHSLY
jgi:hypothetical protein